MSTGISQRGRMLVVDDNQVNRMVLQRALEALGRETVPAPDGLDALTLLAANDFDAVLLNVEMPGLDGYGTLQRIKADPTLARLPVIMVSGVETSRRRSSTRSRWNRSPRRAHRWKRAACSVDWGSTARRRERVHRRGFHQVASARARPGRGRTIGRPQPVLRRVCKRDPSLRRCRCRVCGRRSRLMVRRTRRVNRCPRSSNLSGTCAPKDRRS